MFKIFNMSNKVSRKILFSFRFLARFYPHSYLMNLLD